jgi:hypothetical protein
MAKDATEDPTMLRPKVWRGRTGGAGEDLCMPERGDAAPTKFGVRERQASPAPKATFEHHFTYY